MRCADVHSLGRQSFQLRVWWWTDRDRRELSGSLARVGRVEGGRMKGRRGETVRVLGDICHEGWGVLGVGEGGRW